MRLIRFLQIGLTLGLLTSAVASAQGGVSHALEPARNLEAEVRLAAAKGVPLIVLYSQDDCSWCEKLRREYLGPMSRDPQAPALVRELHMDHATPLLDFNGRRTTSADFSLKVKARFAPTVMFHGPGGRALAEPIIGFRLADFYGAYLDRAIEESRARLKAKNGS
ncbi:MAG: hypothetical protein K9J74_14680 [Sulfuritalea sp.]|nr:hypothetical protein [Sulfuritalea sp.]